MKATLEFSLPENTEEFKDAQNGATWKGIVWSMDQWLRGYLKHGIPEGMSYDENTLQCVRDQLWQFIKDEELSL